ncbi:unnamed protein product [Sphagnum tenellum]
MLLLMICVPKVLSSFKSGYFMSKEARAGCLLVMTMRFAQYAKGTNDNLMRALLSGRHLGSMRRIIELELERESTKS